MSNTPNRETACEAALRFLDSYVRHEHPAEPDRQILQHFDECPQCAAEFEARTRLAHRLKQAVQSETVNPYLEGRIRQRIRESGTRREPTWGWRRRLIPVTVVLVACLGGWIAYQLGHLRITAASQEAYLRTISERVSGILRVGLGDHVHCTVFRKFPKEPPSAPEMLAQLGPEYSGLLELVKARVPAQYRIVMAHRCSYHGRKFVHLALRGDSNLISLVITRKGEGESFAKDGLRPLLSEPGLSVYEGSVQRFAIAGFESRDHLAYLVSDLCERQNLSLVADLAAPVWDFLNKLEG